MSPLPGDQAARDLAVRTRKNVAVTAGAGTGKTTLLVRKILHKVLEEQIPFERILALTFTEKAANEMKIRVRNELRKRDRARGLERAEIGTIHSFCAHVLRQFPIEAGVAPDFEVDEGHHLRRRFEEAWPKWLDAELGPGAKRPRLWRELLSRVDLGDLERLAFGLASFSVPDERASGRAELDGLVEEYALRVPKLADALRGLKEPQKTITGGPEKQAALALAKDVARIEEETVGRALKFADEFARDFRAEYLRAGHLSFDGILLRVHQLLNDPTFPGVRDLLRSRYDVVLVDEVQDTDPVQGEIIRLLCEDASGRLVPGKLFLVGDPKQSIYAFRGADIDAYEGLVRRILEQGGDQVVLRTNFRSHGALIGMVNAAFERIIESPRYEAIEAAADAVKELPGPAIEAVIVEGAKAGESREVEAREIAAWIEKRPEGLLCRDVAILMRSLVEVGPYLEALRAKGIPYVVEGEKYFYGTTEVVDFVNLLRAAANPHDTVAFLGVLRSPYGAAPDREIHGHRKGLDYRSPELPWPVCGRLRRWNAEAGRIGVGAFLDLVMEESRALEIAQMGYHGEQAVANLLKLRAKAGELEARAGCTLREFLDEARKAVRDLEVEGESPLADETLDAVKVLSIHRAKGLEFPVVILPDLHRGKSAGERPVLRFDWPSRTLGVRLGERLNAGAAWLEHRYREREREEARRVLYVACTRAKQKLILLGSDGAGEESFLSLLRPSFEGRVELRRVPYERPPFRPPPAARSPAALDWTAFLSAWKRRESASRPPSRLTSPSRLEEKAGFEHAESAPPSTSMRPALGVECHRILERLDFSKPELPEGTSAEAAALLGKFFKSAAFKTLAKGKLLARELPFVIPRDGRVVQGVIDAVWRRPDGKLVVADWKTDTIVAPENYALIREIYGEAARRVFGEEPVFALVYLRQGRIVEG
jgi:ATP-dependent helicase/nuclease subunit A